MVHGARLRCEAKPINEEPAGGVPHDIYLLNWIHVLSGALWSGADLFMGFILGPTLRMLDIRARTALIAYLVPRTLLYFPMVSLTTIITMGKVSVHQVSCRKSGRGGGVVSIISIRYLAADKHSW